MTPREELALLLRPAAGGLYLVSTGRAEQLAVQRRLYRAETEEQVLARFHEALERIPDAAAILLGVPSDVGAGLRPGANPGPEGIRPAPLDAVPHLPAWAGAAGRLHLRRGLRGPPPPPHHMPPGAPKPASRRALYPGVP